LVHFDIGANLEKTLECNCSAGEMMIFPCAGACNVGQLANDLAKGLSNDEVGKMACIAAIGAGGLMAINAAKQTKITLVLDGCPVGCAKKILERNGVSVTTQVVMTDIGLKKTDELSYPQEAFGKGRTLVMDRLNALPR
jgi:uncharacterized metal-binding protein